MRCIQIAILFAISALFVSCASSNSAALYVSAPENEINYVLQIDDDEASIIRGEKNRYNVQFGDHRIRVSYAGVIVLDSVVNVTSDWNDDSKAAFYAGGVVATGTIALMQWPYGLFWGPVLGITTRIIMPKNVDKNMVNVKRKLSTNIKLFVFKNNYFRLKKFRSNTGAVAKNGKTGIAKAKGLCYDKSTDIVWFQSIKTDEILPLRLNSDIDACYVDGDTWYCDEDSNGIFYSAPCN